MISIPAAPLPEIKILIRHFLYTNKFDNFYYENYKSIYLYSRGMWALASGIQALLSKKKKKEGIVWFPDYFCNQALFPVRQLSIKIDFYPICKKLEPKWDILEKKVKNLGPPDVFVLVHYFGFPNNLKKTKEFCKKYEIELIEDAAHILLPSSGIGEDNNNPIIFSPRKVLPLPEGGILIAPKELNIYIKKQRMVLFNEAVISWFIKRFVQKTMIKLNIPWHKFWRVKKDNKYALVISRNFLTAKNYSIITYKLLCIMMEELKKIVQKCRENYNLLLSELVDDNTTFLFPYLAPSICPYVCPVLVKKNANRIIEGLKNRGVPASSWPDLPSEVLKNKKVYKEAVWLQKHIILFPIHQSLSKKQMKYIVETYKKVISSKR